MRYATLTLSGTARDTQPLVKHPLQAASGPWFRFDRFLLAVEALCRTSRVQTVLVDCRPDFRAPYPAMLEGIRRELVRIAAAGKRLIFVAQSYGTAEVFLSSACPERHIHPLGTFRYQGLHHTSLFLGRLIRETGIRIHPARRGPYKSAPERFTRSDMSRPDREQYNAYLDTAHREFSRTVAVSLGMEESELVDLLYGKVLSAEQAAERGWITSVKTGRQLIEELKAEKTKPSRLRVKERTGRGRTLAVLFFEGAVADGRSRNSPLIGQTIGADSFLPHIRRLRDDRSVAGVLLRINSGGGSATASDDILDELRRLAEKKLLYVSFGDAAASGGYWMACAASKVFTERTTLTGSIGVFSLIVHVDNLLRKYGVSTAVLRRGESADRGSLYRPPTRAEQRELEAEVDRIYAAFLERVAQFRNSTAAEIDVVAQGRVWSGGSALETGLVDRIGGIREALSDMASQLGLRRYRMVLLPKIRYTIIERLLYARLRQSGIAQSALLNATVAWREQLAAELSALSRGVLALSPEAFSRDPL